MDQPLKGPANGNVGGTGGTPPGYVDQAGAGVSGILQGMSGDDAGTLNVHVNTLSMAREPRNQRRVLKMPLRDTNSGSVGGAVPNWAKQLGAGSGGVLKALTGTVKDSHVGINVNLD